MRKGSWLKKNHNEPGTDLQGSFDKNSDKKQTRNTIKHIFLDKKEKVSLQLEESNQEKSKRTSDYIQDYPDPSAESK